MDLSPFKKDIDDLIDEFAQKRLLKFADMKRVWLSRKFSFIYEGRPNKKNTSIFMQGLYAHCIGHLVSTGSLSQKLGGLYCLYCLYEIQPFKPFFKIYMSVGEMKRLKDLVIDAKQNGVEVAAALVKLMLEKNSFLFGSVNIADDSAAKSVEEITKTNEERVQSAQEKLFADSRINHYLHMDLGAELDLENYKKMSTDYAQHKKLAIQEAGKTVDMSDLKQIAEDDHHAIKNLDDIVEQWDARKNLFYIKTGISRNEVISSEDFDKELELMLFGAEGEGSEQ
ncbi:Small nuclear RNA activating complex (SNAPc), subunit SNAP43protein [Zostera marina]|uniref:Small nuclear RNA activating complex (SNAPc), subunit SNAP43protein n=1 Tax=Zostera marina TaxID=29655 RepID=A0A0K9Q0P5_ZOSMR|nr:Small nuclear RNA activating complex (SNAPc), subunit SNAP43protein [Zostera marina]